MADVDVLADSVFKAVESYLARSLEDFTKRMDAVITARIEALPKAKDGENGKDADLSELEEVKVANAYALAQVAALEKKLAELPTPQNGVDGINGEPGKDGTSVDPEVIALMVSKAVAGIEIPAGPPGENGKDAIVDYDRIAEEIAKAIRNEIHPDIASLRETMSEVIETASKESARLDAKIASIETKKETEGLSDDEFLSRVTAATAKIASRANGSGQGNHQP